jgi:hypothetical protein
MDFDNHPNYMDQDIPAGQSPTAQSGPTRQPLNGTPYWMNMTPEDNSRHQPDSGEPPRSKSLGGHILSGISLQAIVVNEWHHIHYQIITLISYVYTISEYHIPIS